jgi:hypothetical protein
LNPLQTGKLGLAVRTHLQRRLDLAVRGGIELPEEILHQMVMALLAVHGG